jgi:hypothetical protein
MPCGCNVSNSPIQKLSLFVVHNVVVGYIVVRYCCRGVIAAFDIVVVSYIVDHYCLRFDRRVVHIVVVGYIVDHYCLRFDRGVVYSNCQQYNQPQQYEPLLCQTSNSNEQQYNRHNNMSHSAVKP